MERIKIRFEKDLIKVLLILEKGGLVIYPTDTAYALGGDATNKRVIEKIFKVKERDKRKTLPCIVSSEKMLKEYCIFKKEARLLASYFWPGPLTLILEKKSPFLLAGDKTSVAARIPNNKIARLLVEKFKKPLISTSANISGLKECYSPKEVLEQFQKKNIKGFVDVIIDGNTLPSIPPSTILDLTKKEPLFRRQGPIKKEEILKVLNSSK